jgi:transcriptional regulator with XRE-family HTH domain
VSLGFSVQEVRCLKVVWSNPMTGLAKHIGNRARARRQLLNLSQSVVAAHLGVSLSKLDTFENGLERIPARQLLVLAEVIEVSVEYFFRDFQPYAESSPTDEQQGRLLEAFRTIKCSDVRAYIVELSTVISRRETNRDSSPSLN